MKGLTIALLSFALSACTPSSGEVLTCQKKGIAYYKEIGSYPRLHSTGQQADEAALEKCQNSLQAFG